MLAAKPDDQLDQVEEWNHLSKDALLTSTCAVECAYIEVHIHAYIHTR